MSLLLTMGLGSIIIVIIILIVWLHSGSSTTKVLLIIASPFLIGIFVLGQVWKAMIAGIMFVFFIHPFDVGDLCVIDQKMMEVRTIGLWKTIFLKVETQEEVIYPNSELFNKLIINLKTDFDWSEHKELEFGILDAEKLKTLRLRIENYLCDEYKFTKSFESSVDILKITRDNIKIAVKFRHNVDHLKNQSYSQYFRIKRKLWSKFILRVHSFIDLEDVKAANEFPYKEQVPTLMMKNLEKWKNVEGDGNCGFRCVADARYKNEYAWNSVRKELLIEITNHPHTYKCIYGLNLNDSFNIALERIKWEAGEFKKEKWMHADDLFAIATKFNYVVISYKEKFDKNEKLDDGYCSTILPLRAEFGVSKPKAELAIVLIGKHYIRLFMKDDCPLPPIDNRWLENRDESVEGWEKIYSDRFDRWKEATKEVDHENGDL
ncbi:unnamed protein product [Amaranthus hypochondriacus]